MANLVQLELLKQGVEAWNKWRQEHLLERPNLDGANLKRVNLEGANLKRVNLHGANFNGANLSRANFNGAILTGAHLNGATLTGANLYGANLKRTNLIRANLYGANLRRTNLYGANLDGTNLSRATLHYTIFSSATVSQVDFTEARLGHTVLANMDISEAKGLGTVHHDGPSTIGIDTILQSKGNIPEVFLRGAGVPKIVIAYLPSLLSQPIQYYSCFISYSHQDKVFARRLHDTLQDRDIRCWLDEHEILPGQKIHVEIDRGIRGWDKVLLCCSKHSLTSWWVNNEIELAIQKEQRLWKERGEEALALIPLNLDGYLFSPEWCNGWKGQITERLAADFKGWEKNNSIFEKQVERVVKALQTGDTGREPPPPPRL